MYSPLFSSFNKERKMKLIPLYLTLASLFSSAAFANDFNTPVSYRYYQLNYTEVSTEDVDDQLKTYNFSMTDLINPNAFVRTNFSYVNKETIIDEHNSLTMTALQGLYNVGTRVALHPKVDLTVETGAIYEFAKELEVKSNSVSVSSDDFDDEFGFNAAIGLGIQLSHQFEFLVDVAYIDIADSSEIEYSAEFVVNLGPNLALVANGVKYEESIGVGFGLQFGF